MAEMYEENGCNMCTGLIEAAKTEKKNHSTKPTQLSLITED
jgi:hypothetical protein